MPLETFYTKTATIKRQSYVGDKSTFNTIATVKGHLRALDETQAAANGFQFGQAHAFQVPVNTDIQESDTLTIDGKEYRVNGVAVHDRGLSTDHRRALLTLGET